MKTRLTLVSSQLNPVPVQPLPDSSWLPVTLCRLSFVAIVSAALAMPALAPADEPMGKFVEALRDRGYFDVAVSYLEQVEPSDLSAESRERLPLEKATTYGLAAAASRDLREAETLLAAAQTAIAAYRPTDATDAKVARTARFRGDLYFNQAQIVKARVANEKSGEAKRQQLTEQLRALLGSSDNAYQSAVKSMSAALKNFQIDSEDSSSMTELKQLRGQYTYLKTRGPTIKEQMAALSKGKARKRLLKEAAAEAKKVWTKYQSYSPAIASCLTAARCYQQLGQSEPSQDMVDRLLELQRSQVPASVRREALSIAAKNWQKADPFPWETVLAETENPVKLLTAEQVLNPQWQDVQLVLARAWHEKSQSLAGQKGANVKREAKEASENAIKLAQTVAQATGDAREQAVGFLKKWGSEADLPAPALGNVAEVKAKSFASAVQLGRATLPDIESQLRKIKAAKRKIQQNRDSGEKQHQKKLTQLKRQQLTKTGAALNLFNQAILLADESTPAKDINNVRYLQSYCYFAREQYIESSVIAEFLLENYPNDSRQSAAILIRNQAAMLERTTGDNSFEKQQLVRSCKSILERYPGTTEASSAAARLAWLSLGENHFDQAKSWFEKIPPGDPQRTGLALSMGRRNWFAWSKLPPNKRSKSENQLAVAKQYLTEGVTNSNPKTLTYAAAEGALLLAQALLASDDLDGAIKRLESDEIAPLKLVEPVHAVVASTGRTNLYHQQTVITAIKIYMAAMSGTSQGQAKWIDKAGKAITGLQKRLKASKDAEAMKQLTSIYRLISQRLIEQFDSLPTGQRRNEFAIRMAAFLTEIEKQSLDSRTVVWAGSTLLSVANTLRQDKAETQAETIYAKAVSALDRAEQLGFGDGDDAVAMTRELNRQRALAQRGAGNFDTALAQFTQLLTEKAGDLNMQLDAAATLQQMAASNKNAQGFATAILGTAPVADPKTKRKRNAIWGWRKLVQITRGKSQFQNAFYQSLYHMIEARYEMSRIDQSAEGTAKALKELDNWQQRDPDFDNGVWKQKFAQLRQRIQKQ